MFGFIKKLFGGIFAFISGLIGGKKSEDGEALAAPKAKKSNGYYLELDETGNTKAEEAVKKAKPAKAESQAQAGKPEPVEKAVAVAEAVKAKLAAPEKQPKTEKVKVATAEPQNGKVTIEAQPNPPAPNNGKVDPESERTFAPNYLLQTVNSSRRRPGPSMAMFRDMARQVKNPS